jgi:hypothetical protein
MGGVKCRQCGSEIADKALVCYRCGAATTEPKFRAPAPGTPTRRRTANLVTSVLAIVLLALSGLYMAQVASGDAPAMLRWVVVVLAAAIVIVRVVVRRSRR